jgi:ABC-type Fe3+ transport system substrate-binding protein
MGLFGKKTSKKIEQLDDLIFDLNADINIKSRQIEQADKKARDLMKKAIGAPNSSKQLIAAQVQGFYSTARSTQRALSYKIAVYSAATAIKSSYEAQELETEGALKALKKIVGAKTMSDLSHSIRDLAKGEQKIGIRLSGLAEQIEQSQDALSASSEMNNSNFMSIMNELESLPPEKIDDALNSRLKVADPLRS